jgi:hypothetical protein
MTRGRIDTRQRQADLLRKKRAQTAMGFAPAAKMPVAAVPIASRSRRPFVGRDEPMPPMRYPTKRVAIGKRQAPGGGG